MHGPVRLWTYALSMLIGACAGAGLMYLVHIQIQSDERLEQQKATMRAIDAAQTETTRLQEQSNHAIRKATKRAQANASAAADARSELDRLRSAIAAGSGSSTCKAGIVSADPARELFSECAAALTDMARKADGHASDALMMRDAWPESSGF